MGAKVARPAAGLYGPGGAGTRAPPALAMLEPVSAAAPPDLVVRSRRVVLPDGVRPAAVVVRDGRIEAVLDPDAPVQGAAVLDAGERVVLPGSVDPHVHVNEPGRTEWEGFETAGRAAAAGGVTTIVDMPLNAIPPTVTPAALAVKRSAAEGVCRVDVGFWAGLVPGGADAMAATVDAGALGAKAFLVDSGVPEFPPVGEADLERGMEALAARGAPLLAHAEWPAALRPGELEADPGAHAAWLASRPPEAEVEAIRRLIRLAGETGAAIHVVHLSAAGALPDLAAARAGGLPITVETCPHYLTFDAGEIGPGDARFKCAPPIRDAANRERLWEALADGTIDLVASDHSPCPTEAKRGDFRTAWGGVASLGVGLAALWTEASARGFGLADLARWTAAAPARLAGLEGTKGAIAAGLDADLAVWDPDAESVVEAEDLRFRHPVSAWTGRRLRGRVVTTLLRGRVVYDEGAFPGAPAGRSLARVGVGSAP